MAIKVVTTTKVKAITAKRTLATAVPTATPVCTIGSDRKITALKVSAVCKLPAITPPIPPVAVDIGLTITSVAAHPIAIGQPIYITPVGTIDLAIQSSIPCIGIALNNAAPGESVGYASEGHVTRDNWTAVAGDVYLLPGLVYFLAGTGQITHVPPTTGLIQRVGIAASRFILDIEVTQAVQLVQ